MDAKIYRRRAMVFVPMLVTIGIGVALFWASFALFVSDMHFGWAIGMLVFSVLFAVPSLLYIWRLLRFKVILRHDRIIAPKIRPLNIKVDDKTIAELREDLEGEKSISEEFVGFVTEIFDNRLFGGRYKREKEDIEFSFCKSFDVAKIRTGYKKFFFIVFDYIDGTKRVIDVRPLGDEKAGKLVEEISTYLKKGKSFEREDEGDEWGEYMAVEGGVHLIGEILVGIIGGCCGGG